MVGFSLGVILSITRDLPQVQALEDFEPSAATRIFSADGEMLAQFFIARRLPVPLSQMPDDLKKAVISIEDRRFYQHAGFDIKRNIGALVRDIQQRRLAQGASTITQQLARDLFLTPEKTVSRKLKELFLALQIERRYTKDEILEFYLNQIMIGPGAYGMEAVARMYFGKSVSDLNLAECALLAGLPPSPARYSPLTHPDRALARRKLVLRAMLRDGQITREQYEETVNAPLELNPQKSGLAKAPYFSELVRQFVVERYGQNMLYRGGLEIRTTLDYQTQLQAEKAVKEGLERLSQEIKPPVEERPQGALVALEPGTGRILALVGGEDFQISPFNRATQALRQPGSSFKPFIYTAAIEHGFTQADRLWDAPITFNLPGQAEPWEPQNYSREFKGEISLRHALEVSQNIPAIKLLIKIGLDNVIATAHLMGLTSNLNRNLALALGASEVRLVELVSAYNCLASGGLWIEPWGVSEITDRNGLILFKARPQHRVVLSLETAYIMTDMLKGVIEYGTGKQARVLGRPLAGKTGTTDDCRDALFVGYSPTLSAGAWVGYDSNRSLGRGITGARGALPIWIDFMGQAHEGKAVEDFKKPPGIVMIPMDRITGLPAAPGSENLVQAAFKRGTEPW